jgi:hypothetical protein
MRIKNKEIRRRRHRKEQIVKAAERELRAQYAGKAAAPAAEKPAPKAKAAPKKADAPAKPKKAPAKKKAAESEAE